MKRKAKADDAVIAAEQVALAAAQAAERERKKRADLAEIVREEEELRELNATATVEEAERVMADRADSMYQEEETLSESEDDAQYRALEEICRRERGLPTRQRADPVVGLAPQRRALIPGAAIPEPGRTRSPSPIKHLRSHRRESALLRHSSPTDAVAPRPSANRPSYQEPRRPRAGSQRNPESGLPSRADPEVGLARHLPDSGSRKLPSGLSQRTSQERSREQRECSQTEGLLRALRMPLIEITRFSGNPLEFANFMADFEESIEPGCTTDSERLSRLYHYCEGEAKEVVRSFRADRHNPDSYMAAKQRLQDLYGRNNHVAQQWVDRLLAMRVTSIRDMALQARNGLSALRQLGGEQEMDATVHMRALVARLPSYLQTRWRRKVVDIEEWSETPRFADLVAFLERAAQEDHHPTFGKVSGTSASRTTTSASSFAIAAEETTPEACYLCQGEHTTSLCPKFVNATVDQRRDMVAEYGMCYSCLGRGHWVTKCRAGMRCTVPGCSRRHHALLHPDSVVRQGQGASQRQQQGRPQPQQQYDPLQAASAQANQGTPGDSNAAIAVERPASGSQEPPRTALPIVPVQVTAPGSSKMVLTHALLDSGSTATFCDERLLKRLGVKGSKKSLDLTTLGSSRARTCRVAMLNITPIDGGAPMRLDRVHALGRLPVKEESMVTPQDLEQWSHLRGLPIKDSVGSGSPLLLLGADCTEVLRPREVRTGGPGEPYGMLTGLGWTVVGPLKGGRRSGGETCGYVQIANDEPRQPSAQGTETPTPSKAGEADETAPKKHSSPARRRVRRSLETRSERGDKPKVCPAQAKKNPVLPRAGDADGTATGKCGSPAENPRRRSQKTQGGRRGKPKVRPSQTKGNPVLLKAGDADDAAPGKCSGPAKKPGRRSLEVQGGGGVKPEERPAQAEKSPVPLSARDAGDMIVKLRSKGRRKLAGVERDSPGEDGMVSTVKVWTCDPELVPPVSELCIKEASA